MLFAGLFLSCCLVVVSAVARAEEVLTLAQAYRLALKRSESLAISEEAVLKAQAQYRQVLARTLPELSLRYTSLWQDQTGLADLGAFGGSFTRSPLPESSFRIKLPFLTGYRELAALKAGKSLVQQRRHERRRLEQMLYQDVASAYYAALVAEHNLGTTEKVLELTRERLEELKAREKVGRSREAEVLDVKAEIAGLESQREGARFTVRIARNLLGFLTGSRVEATLEKWSVPLKPPPLEEYLERVRDRPDLQAKREALEVALAAVRSARAGHFPGAELTANYYTQRVGFRRAIDWDSNLTLTVPLWSWGAVRSAVEEAEASRRQAEKDLELGLRRAELEIADTHERLVSSIRRAELQAEALELVRRSYDLRTREYRQGLATNFEVLDALSRLQRTELAANAARLEAALDAVQLDLAAGKLP